ncbi:histidine kinase [candidate division KSB1 bacterium]|nr:histidine kinase [candidate division KSB1 bacterium]
MKSLVLLTMMFFCTLAAYTANVTFTVRTAIPLKEDSVYIAGNTELLGNWHPEAITMKKLDVSNWSLKLEFPTGTRLEYKFTRGSWDTEAVDSTGKVPDNYRLFVKNDTTVFSLITNWKDEFIKPVKRGVTGKVVVHKNFAGNGLLLRDIIVWLPPDYEKQQDKRYPVLYMHDGQNMFDPKTSFTGVDWGMDETADSLIRKGEIYPIIIAGIANTKNRSTEYLPSDTCHSYMELVVKRIKPFIDSTYRTLPGPEFTATGGSSAGGLVAFMLAWEYPHVFSKAACLSPAFKVRHIDYVIPVQNDSSGLKNIALYIDNGGKGVDELLAPGIEEMRRVLEDKGYHVIFYSDPEADHNEDAWGRRVWRPLKLFFKK